MVYMILFAGFRDGTGNSKREERFLSSLLSAKVVNVYDQVSGYLGKLK